MKKLLILALIVLTGSLFLAGCTNQEITKQEEQILPMNDSEDSTLDNQEPEQAILEPGDEAIYAENKLPETKETTKEFSMVAKNWDFVPSQITVNKGDNVILKITSTDVKHGISIPKLGIKADLNPGQETVVEFKADEVGTFPFFCNVFCGHGHGDMKGTILVK